MVFDYDSIAAESRFAAQTFPAGLQCKPECGSRGSAPCGVAGAGPLLRPPDISALTNNPAGLKLQSGGFALSEEALNEPLY